MNAGFGPTSYAIAARDADAPQSADQGRQEVGGHSSWCTVRWPDAEGTSEVYCTLACTDARESAKAQAAEVSAEFERLENVAPDSDGEEFGDDGGADGG